MMMTTAVEAGLVRMMRARYEGRCARCSSRIRVGRRMGYSATAKLTFCEYCSEGFASGQDYVGEVRRLIEEHSAAQATAARRGCGQCQSCLAGGGPCDEQ